MSMPGPSSLLGATLLRPVIALNVWTFAMEAWMYATRIPAITKYNVKLKPDADAGAFNSQIPAHIRWKADNYNHLMEQPTQFYAVAITLALLQPEDSLNEKLAWGYVGLRVVHSLIHATANPIMIRFYTFAASSFVLLGMTARAALLLF